MRNPENSKIRDTYRGKNRKKCLSKSENGQIKLKIFELYFFWQSLSEMSNQKKKE